MRAVRSTPPGVAVVDVDEPDGPGELLTISSASICASDFGYIEFGSQFLLGHELAGMTEDGRAVAIEAIFGCGECDLCLEGRYNLCATTGHDRARDHGRRWDERMVPRPVAFARRAPRRSRPRRRVPGGTDRRGVARVSPRRRGTGAAGGASSGAVRSG